MKRRKLLAGLGSLAAGGAAAMGTNAFAVEARNRDATGRTVRDDNAYLQLLPNSENGKTLSEIGGDGEVDVTLNRLNSDSLTEIENVFFIENNGTGPVDITINVSFSDPGVSIDAVFVSSGDAPNGNDLTDGTRETLGVGQRLGVGVRVDIQNKGRGPTSGTFTVDAN